MTQMQFYSIGKAAKMLGLAKSTLRNMHLSGELIPDRISKGGTRYYSLEQLNQYSGIKPSKKRVTIGYCRVSSKKQHTDLERQVERMEIYLTTQGKPFEIIKDIGSGINYTKPGIQSLIKRVENDEVDKIVVFFKDRLVRFGFELLETICNLHNTEIEIIDQSNKTNEEELTEDLVQIITVFASRLQGRRSKKIKSLIKEVEDV